MMAFPDETSPLLEGEEVPEEAPAQSLKKTKKAKRVTFPKLCTRTFALIKEKQSTLNPASTPLHHDYVEFYQQATNIVVLAQKLAEGEGYSRNHFFRAARSTHIEEELIQAVSATEKLIKNPSDKAARQELFDARADIIHYSETLRPSSAKKACYLGLGITLGIVGFVVTALALSLVVSGLAVPLLGGAIIGGATILKGIIQLRQEASAYKESQELIGDIRGLLVNKVSKENNSATPSP